MGTPLSALRSGFTLLRYGGTAMKQLILIGMMLMISISCYAQESQESYTLLMLDFENRTGLENPLLDAFNETIAFVLSRQTGPVQVGLVPAADQKALLARAVAMHRDKSSLEQGLLAAEWIDADALVAGSYTKQEGQWSLESQVYHRKEGSKTRQEIQIQGDNFYKLLDGFPAQLLQQFAASYAALTTDSWKAYEEFRKGHEAFDNYNFLLALEHYDKALKLDPTLALAYAEQSYVYFMTGQVEQATKAIEAAKQWLPKVSPMEQLVIRILANSWDAETKTYKIWEWWQVIELAPGGVWDEVLIHGLIADIYEEEGKRAEADQHYQQWFEAIQRRTRMHPDDASLLHNTADRCRNIGRYVDEAIDMELKAVELNLEESTYGPRYVLSRLYERKGDMEQALEWLKQSLQEVPDARLDDFVSPYSPRWHFVETMLRKAEVSPERLTRWCEDVLRIPGLHLPDRLSAQYLMAQAYEFMNDTAKADAILTSLGAPRESDWMVIGAFDAPAENPFPNTAPFGLLTDLTATHMGILDKEIQWETWEDEEPMDGILRIGDVFGKKYSKKHSEVTNWDYTVFSPPSVAYSCIYVEVSTAMKIQVRTGAGNLRIWLNDDPSSVIQGDSVWQAIPDIEVNDVSLKAGLNRFLVATAFGLCAFDFTFRITDHDGNAIPGLRYISAKEVLASH
jgi:tetratricopeptide (TPR) repeat protein